MLQYANNYVIRVKNRNNIYPTKNELSGRMCACMCVCQRVLNTVGEGNKSVACVIKSVESVVRSEPLRAPSAEPCYGLTDKAFGKTHSPPVIKDTSTRDNVFVRFCFYCYRCYW